jgi:hypothetical protein
LIQFPISSGINTAAAATAIGAAVANIYVINTGVKLLIQQLQWVLIKQQFFCLQRFFSLEFLVFSKTVILYNMRRYFVQFLLIASPADADAAEIFTAAAASAIAATSAAASISGEIRNWIGIKKQSVKAKIISMAAAGAVAAAAAATAAATLAVIATATSHKAVKISSCI